MGEFGVADVGGAEDAVAGRAVALGEEDAGGLPGAQGGRGESEAVGEFADAQGERAGVGGGLRGLRQVFHRSPDRGEGLPVAEQLGVAVVERGQGLVGPARVDGVHDRPGRRVPVGADEGEEGAQRRRVQLGVDPVPGGRPFGCRQEAVLLVVADGLRGEAVLASQVDRSQSLRRF